MRNAASSCRVSSCSSRAQRTRSRSEASTLRRSPWAATFCAVMTAVAAVAAKACIRRWSSAVNSGRPPCGRRRPGRRPPRRGRPAGRSARSRRRRARPARSAAATGRRPGARAAGVRRTSPATDPATAIRRPTTSAGTSPAAAWTTSSSPSRSATSIARASTRARPRLTSSSRMRSRSVSPPTARAIDDVVSSAETARSSSSRRDGDAAVQASVLDRDRRPVGQDDERLLVGLVEVAAGLLGQVEVAVGLAADEDRHAQEAVHRRVAEREAVGARVVADVGHPQWPRIADQDAEDPVAAGQVADRAVGRPRRSRGSGSARAPGGARRGSPARRSARR